MTVLEEGPVFLISDLCDLLESYLEPAQVAEVYRAYLFGAEAHEGQHRLSGEPYIYHPLAVARILAEMRMDACSIVAAILHDVIEDTTTAKEQLVTEFGEEVAELVDGVSKLTHIEFESKAEAQAENFRKMMLAMVRDIRVILIKLADRLHNMRTLGVMRPDKRRRIARETLETYAPIASRLGINSVRLELQDLGFAAYHPMRYQVLAEAVRKACGHRKEVVLRVQSAIQERLRQENLSGEIDGREKHLYSIYKKMRNKNVSFTDVMDVFALRIVVDSVDTCYRVLGAVHNLYKPMPGKFKDYIAIPKANGYQSLHTTLLSPYGFPLEVQIRTEDMDKVARAGIAAHWLYKSGEESHSIAQARARQWLSNLLEMQKSAGDSMEFLENVKVDLFPDEVYVFTPKGEIMELPRGATAVDFAYAVHTDVGKRCVAAKVERRLVPLHTKLQSGQSVEVITAPGARPNPTWLNFVVTGKARATIRHYLKNLKRDESVALGRRMLEKAMAAHERHLDDVSSERLRALLTEYKLETLEDLLAEIGLGNRMAPLVTGTLMRDQLVPRQEPDESADQRPSLVIKGTEGTVVSFAKCCRPIPGDHILGFLTAGRGVVVHTQTCKNLSEYRKRPERWLDVEWENGVEGDFPVDIRIEVANQRGVLATLAANVAETGANIDNVSLEERDGVHAAIFLTLSVSGRRHLARIIRRLRTVPEVLKITRVRG
ncbi:bifunctional GTP diphosphokinase/guanosine-3',5'-bis pyrophosphate 3'-pyrophosphohydrolase [Thiohalomonas denitrificans]|uniref:bifunctional GTP diphosphokinase/guanosine-3',5'-bis pyrophosphate 3'-pyrophosphohydrolase n=1 Tax=Thiohalomonas denitrificans TaxID=415747 RepID=UPI0026EB59AE|nr:bifunctional GTP diphosphokinase/guanosine-3',5'-bis pyrophosphate 3'-pyrophosphohydrolase [Thiohalomonas denitrificans]